MKTVLSKTGIDCQDIALNIALAEILSKVVIWKG
jgi:hypothetical protein